MRKAKHPIQEFNGVKFYRKPSGYYKADHYRDGGVYMHRYVWGFYNDSIPAGHDIHHIDGDRTNNRIENLECISKSVHASHHGRARCPKGSEQAKQRMAEIRPLASEWHRSPEGREWHRQHAVNSVMRPRPEHRTCAHCGKPFIGKAGHEKRGFCGPACQSAARRASGVDDVERSCVECGRLFSINKYERTVSCSRECASVISARKRRKNNVGVRPDSE